MPTTASLGFPRIGPQRELKRVLERYWRGKVDRADFDQQVATIRAERWQTQREHGVAIVPSNDFSLYDHMLDTACMVGAVPARFGAVGNGVSLDQYFTMARGAEGVPALEMTKWFDTNYHYLVPELSATTSFALDASKVVAEFTTAKGLGINTRPVVVGPVTFLLLSKMIDGGDSLTLLPQLTAAYAELFRELSAAGADWVQCDEPILATDLTPEQQQEVLACYRQLAKSTSLKIMLATYFGDLGDNLSIALTAPVAGLHIDLIRGPSQLERLAGVFPSDRVLSLGLIDGRNIWRSDLDRARSVMKSVAEWHSASLLQIAPSCSLLHCPWDVTNETQLDPEVRAWLSFSVQKCEELSLLSDSLDQGGAHPQLVAQREALAARRSAPNNYVPAVRERCAAVTAADFKRSQPYAQRSAVQQARLKLPPFPTTTIGSFPQTVDIRKQRRAYKDGQVDRLTYEDFIEQETKACIERQEAIGLDVLVHGEFERNDMVEYFGEQLDGFVFTANGWVQSYGSRCVKPPIIVGDVSRPQPMTVRWATFAQQCSERPVKGMLTGPVTILNWSFVRDDLPRAEVCQQLALALRDEVHSLERAGIAIIQVDEAALREGLPLRHADRGAYLQWAVDSFRLTTSGVAQETQIHTHMCYSEFNDIIESIANMDADVITIESARSRMELLEAFEDFAYPNAIGPGVYDIHSPRVPDTEEMVGMLERAVDVLIPEQLWVNPDCGLKTRAWPETEASLRHMVQAAQEVRTQLSAVATEG